MAYTINDEKIKQNEHSPGIVKDEETLLRVGYSPEHIVEGRVVEAAVSLSDLKERGFSIDRKSYAQPLIIKQRIDKQMQQLPDKRNSCNIIRSVCSVIRKVEYADLEKNIIHERAFLIIDTALKENPAHASIYSAIEGGNGMLRKLRHLLIPLLQNICSFEDIFPEKT